MRRSTRRVSICSHLIANLDLKIKERLLNLPISREQLKKFDEKEKREVLSMLVDLRDISSRSETEVYNTLNRMYKNNQ